MRVLCAWLILIFVQSGESLRKSAAHGRWKIILTFEQHCFWTLSGSIEIIVLAREDERLKLILKKNERCLILFR